MQDDIAEEIIEKFYVEPGEVDADEIKMNPPLLANEYMILRNGKKSVLACMDGKKGRINRIDRHPAYSIQPRNADQTFALHSLLNTSLPLVTIPGKAGTGKTLLALAAALERRSSYRQVMLARPVIPLCNKDIGYLPGDIQSKLKSYMQPLYDNLGVIRNQFPETSHRAKKIHQLLEEEKLIIEPLAYIRGRSLVNIFLIVDEAQNLTPHEVKTIITRAGEGLKNRFHRGHFSDRSPLSGPPFQWAQLSH